jgi:hypothetical protein
MTRDRPGARGRHRKSSAIRRGRVLQSHSMLPILVRRIKAMAATKSQTGITPTYHVSNADNLHISIGQGPNRIAGTVKTVTLSAGGSAIELTQTNVSDLLVMLTTFSSTGVVS